MTPDRHFAIRRHLKVVVDKDITENVRKIDIVKGKTNTRESERISQGA